ncbi:MAG: hypothetical protein IIT68_08445 [Treponema sp.]|nr:hypothetical protein [Treponema sp.]
MDNVVGAEILHKSYGNYVMCETSGKVCYTEREAGGVINGCKKHLNAGNSRSVKAGHGKNIPRRKYFCKVCGFYHVSHFGSYEINPRAYTHEEIFYREVAKQNKARRQA